MSTSTSLYRRHRPGSFDEVVGQQHVVRTLRNAVEQDKVNHAYLFVGSRGTGKTSMAKILARSLNCERGGPTVTPCGECESCVTIAAGTSMDVIEMDAASNRSVDDVRDLRERVAYAPAAGRWKVYILDEAHMLTKEAWNAFLKTLEEPPPNTVFVLATTESHKVMATIADRCQRFDFGRPSLDQIAEVVRRVAAAESIEVDDGAVSLIARSAQGSFRDALGTLDQLVSYGGSHVDMDGVLAVLGVGDTDLLFEIVDAVAAEDPKAVLQGVERMATSGRDPTQFAREMLGHLRHLLVVQTIGEVPDSFILGSADADRLRAQSSAVGAATLLRAIDELAGALTAVREGDEARLSIEVALLRAARPELDPSTEGLLRRIERLEAGGGAGGSAGAGGPAPAAARPAPAPEASRQPEPATPAGPAQEPAPGSDAPTATAVADPPPAAAASAPETEVAPEAAAPQAPSEPEAPGEELTLEKLTRLWPAVLDELRQGSAMLSALYEGARPLALEGGGAVVRVGFPPDATFNKRKAEAAEQRDRFSEALRKIAGQRLSPVYVLIDGEADPVAGVEEVDVDEDELMERLKSEFNAEEVAEF
jgi:DNA polymerase-3 subunit gamma/tau